MNLPTLEQINTAIEIAHIASHMPNSRPYSAFIPVEVHEECPQCVAFECGCVQVRFISSSGKSGIGMLDVDEKGRGHELLLCKQHWIDAYRQTLC